MCKEKKSSTNLSNGLWLAPSFKDSVAFSDLIGTDLSFYTAVNFYRDKKIIFTYKDTTIEIVIGH